MSPLEIGCGSKESDDQMRIAIELREAMRCRLTVPAHFIWAPQDGKGKTGHGVTRDINTSGVFVQADSSPGMHLQGESIVLRCEHGDATKRGFAASAQFYPEASEAVLPQIRVSGQV